MGDVPRCNSIAKSTSLYRGNPVAHMEKHSYTCNPVAHLEKHPCARKLAEVDSNPVSPHPPRYGLPANLSSVCAT